MTYLLEILLYLLNFDALRCCFGLSLRDIYSQFHLQQKVLDAAMNDINNSFGKGSVTRLGSAGGAFVYVCSFLIP
jgi:hypothetical protein